MGSIAPIISLSSEGMSTTGAAFLVVVTVLDVTFFISPFSVQLSWAWWWSLGGAGPYFRGGGELVRDIAKYDCCLILSIVTIITTA